MNIEAIDITVTVGVPVTLAGNAWAGNANTVQMSVTSNEGLSAATAHALIETSYNFV